MIPLLVAAFLAGAAVVLVAQFVLVKYWYDSIADGAPASEPDPVHHCPPALPQELADLANSGAEELRFPASCAFLNLLGSFIFADLKDSLSVKRFLMRKITAELEELLLSKVAGKVILDLMVRDYSLGKALPVIDNVSVVKCHASEDDILEELDIEADIRYSGGFHIVIEAMLVFGKSASVSVRVNRLDGRIVLKFTRHPFTHWSFAFCREPVMDLEVTSTLGGQSYEQLTTLIRSQIRRSVRKKHTLPNYKVRYKPFFARAEPQDETKKIYMTANGDNLSQGQLRVEVVEATRLPKVQHATHIFCTLGVGREAWAPTGLTPRWNFETLSIEVSRGNCNEPLGAVFVEASDEFDERSQLTVVGPVQRDSRADSSGLKQNDIILSINRLVVSNLDHACNIVHTQKNLCFEVHRPPAGVSVDVAILEHLTAATATTTASSTAAGGGRDTPPMGRLANEDDDIPIPDSFDISPSTSVPGRGQSGPTEMDLSTWTMVDGTHQSRPVLQVHSTRSGTEAYDPEVNSLPKQTCPLPACASPAWKEKFSFSLTEEDSFLSVCTWARLENSRRNLLIGYTSIALHDVAVECAAVRVGRHEQCFVLVPGIHLRASANRAALKAAGAISHGKLPQGARTWYEREYGGDVRLVFHHEPTFSGPTAAANSGSGSSGGSNTTSGGVGGVASSAGATPTRPSTGSPRSEGRGPSSSAAATAMATAAVPSTPTAAAAASGKHASSSPAGSAERPARPQSVSPSQSHAQSSPVPTHKESAPLATQQHGMRQRANALAQESNHTPVAASLPTNPPLPNDRSSAKRSLGSVKSSSSSSDTSATSTTGGAATSSWRHSELAREHAGAGARQRGQSASPRPRRRAVEAGPGPARQSPALDIRTNTSTTTGSGSGSSGSRKAEGRAGMSASASATSLSVPHAPNFRNRKQKSLPAKHDFVFITLPVPTPCTICGKKIFQKQCQRCQGCMGAAHTNCALSSEATCSLFPISSTFDSDSDFDDLVGSAVAASISSSPDADGEDVYGSPMGEADVARAAAAEAAFASVETDKVVREAGRGLYGDLPVPERKLKLTEQIKRLQLEINNEKRKQAELLDQRKQATAERHRAVVTECISHSNNKLEALTLLMLQYLSGLHVCEEATERSTA